LTLDLPSHSALDEQLPRNRPEGDGLHSDLPPAVRWPAFVSALRGPPWAPRRDHTWQSARVSLDRLLISKLCFAWIEPHRPPSPSLTEQVPALVQHDLEASEPLAVSVGHLPLRFALEQLMLLARKFVNPAEDLRVVHRASFLSPQCLYATQIGYHAPLSPQRHGSQSASLLTSCSTARC